MRKKIIRFVVCLCFLLLAGNGSVSAAQSGVVYDDAGLLTDSEISTLNEKITAFKEASGWNVYAVTTADAKGKTAEAYADDFFDSHSPDQEDGVAFLIDMENREIWLSGCGEANRYLTDERIDEILDDAFVYISEGDYAGCLESMADGTQNAYQAGIPDHQYNYDTETGKISAIRSVTFMEVLVALLLACISGGLVFAGIVGKYRLKFGTYQYAFRDYGKVNLRVRDDRFINQTVTRRNIPKPTNSGTGGSSGRSSTHRSSSGRSHTGGGRKF